MVHGCACTGCNIHRAREHTRTGEGGRKRERGNDNVGGKGGLGGRRSRRRPSNPVFTFIRSLARVAHIHIFISTPFLHPLGGYTRICSRHGGQCACLYMCVCVCGEREPVYVWNAHRGATWRYFTWMQEAQLCRDVWSPTLALAKLIRPRAFETSAARAMCVRPQARFPRDPALPLSLSLYLLPPPPVTKSGYNVDLGAIPGPRFTICQATARARNRLQDNGFWRFWKGD